MTAINTTEQKIIFILLNYMVLEGAKEHFDAQNPNERLFLNLKNKILASPPKRW
jgi:hypothetical protein